MTDIGDTGTWADGSDRVRWEYAQLHYWIDRSTGREVVHLTVHLPGARSEEVPLGIVDALNALGKDGWEAFGMEHTNALVSGELGFQRAGLPVRRRFWLKRPVS